MTLPELFELFICFYSEINEKDIKGTERTDVLKRLNSGDCGTAAIAVGWVWHNLTGEEVLYHDNNAHGYIEVNGRFYDTLQPEGRDSHREIMGYNPEATIMSGDVEFMHHQFMFVDPLGVSWINQFATMHQVKAYPFTAEE